MGDPPRSPTPDFHGVLGISKSASLKEICKAYKSLVKKWHPDKNHSNKTEAEAKFKAINEAYKALNTEKQQEKNCGEEPTPTTPTRGFFQQHKTSADDSFFSRPSFLSRNASRRSHTPQPAASRCSSRRSPTPTPTTDFPCSSPLASPSTRRSTTPTSSPTSLSKSVSRRSTTPIIFSQSTARKKPPPIEKKLDCTLEELCNGCVKKIKITKDVIKDFGIIVQEEEILKIRIKPGWKKGTKITFEGKGDERPGYYPADITFSINEKRHPLFKREGDDLEIGVEVPLVHALTGCSLSVPLLGGEAMHLYIDDIIYPDYEKVIRGQGMPNPKDQGRRGDLRIKFLVNFPTELSDQQRKHVVSILQDSS